MKPLPVAEISGCGLAVEAGADARRKGLFHVYPVQSLWRYGMAGHFFFTPMMSVSLLMKPAMQQQNLLDDMRELNLSYLMLAQRMLREDYPVGLFRLGLSADVADALLKLSPPQLLRLSNLNMALGRLRLDSPEVVAALSGKDVMGGALQRARMAIMMAGQPVERIA